MKNSYNIPITKENFHLAFLKTLNGVLGFSDKEILILNEFIQYEQLYDNEPDIIFSTYTRKKIQTKLDMSSSNLNNYIKSLKEKRAVQTLNGVDRIDKRIIPTMEDTDKSFTITFNFIKQ